MNSSNQRLFSRIVLLLVVVGLIALALGGYLTPLTRLSTTPFLSAQEWLAIRYAALRDYLTAPQDVAALRQRNQQLEAEVARLQTEVVSLQQQLAEAKVLAALLDFARAHPTNQYKAARVIGQDPSPFLHYVIVNRGSDDGIRPGMPVVSPEGLVGYVDAVIPQAARVRLITDPGSRVDVRVKPANVDAVLQGSVTGELTLNMLPLDAKVQPGNLVLTSGLGGRFPADLLVGQVVSTRKQAFALFQEAAVQPVVDFARLDIVLIIVNFQPVDITPLMEQP
ncbi:MAG TPA: rod shape-determining protein MreC [Anaerolineae bacterium]|nr:rod shape-determining protein MreC [Anaerolineae bacterium]HID85089.1 rod shape-determining protein MreC [Anaerolineales bacterium]